MTELDIVAGRIICAGTFSFTGEQINTYTPVLTAETTNPGLGTGPTQLGWWVKFGRLIMCWGRVAFGTAPTAGSGNYRITLPTEVTTFSPLNFVGSGPLLGTAICVDNSALATNSRQAVPQLVETYTPGTGVGQFRMYTADGSSTVVSNSNPFTWAASDRISYHCIYPAPLTMVT